MHKVFEKYSIGDMTLENRIARSATMWRMGHPDGSVSDLQVEWARQLAENHIGLIIKGMATISRDGRVSARQNRLDDDRYIEGHRKITEAVHETGGRIVCQINHCGAASDHEVRLSPSGIPYPFTKDKPSVAMTVDDIKRITREFAETALRVKKAGYDGVQIHCAHGYLLSQFISPVFNKRTDEYGGDGVRRFRFAGEVLDAVKEAVGEEFQVSVKINSNIEENDESYLPDLLMMCREMKKKGIAFIELSGCDFTPRGRAGEHHYYLERAALVRKEVDITVMLVGGIRSVSDMEKVIDSGIDMVSISRPFLCEPDLITKYLNGQQESKCVSCSKCFLLLYQEIPDGPKCVQHVRQE